MKNVKTVMMLRVYPTTGVSTSASLGRGMAGIETEEVMQQAIAELKVSDAVSEIASSVSQRDFSAYHLL
ncbi:hypothetical protein L917_17911 [Phytophthora nicotianae]|nr:hypothetical protein L917_17911 [Phytophthora nicotianae]